MTTAACALNPDRLFLLALIDFKGHPNTHSEGTHRRFMNLRSVVLARESRYNQGHGKDHPMRRHGRFFSLRGATGQPRA